LWIAAFFGGMTKYSEVVLAVKYREMDEKGFYNGGPMYYIANGLGPKFRWLAVFFAFFATLATFGIGNMTQANSIAQAINRAVGGINPDLYVPTVITGLILAVLVGLVIIGGIKRIAAVAEKIIPGIAILWSLGCIVFIGMNLSRVSTAFESIFRGAFGLYSAAGGVAGYTIMTAVRRGIARGVFSNEAGLGSAPIAHAATRGKDPVKQGFWAIFEVFWDTIICTCTAIVILTAGFYHNASGADLIIDSFNSLFTLRGIGFGGIFVAVCILFFAGTTIIGWSYYGERCLGFLTKNNPRVLLIYKVIFCGMTIVGATGGLTLVWDIADTLNGLMALPNLIALLLLRKVVLDLTKKYIETGSAIEKEHISR
jgi:AGCS family alanine or glycine:cation symporter